MPLLTVSQIRAGAVGLHFLAVISVVRLTRTDVACEARWRLERERDDG